MVTLMQFRQELILTSGGPRNAIDKKKERKNNDGKKYILRIQYQFYFSDGYIAD